MRICLYTDTALPKLGGQELVVDALAREFHAAGHQVTVLAPQPRRPLRPNDARLPYRVVRHPRFLSARLWVAWYRRWLLRLHRTQPFDLLHCHGIYPPGYLAALCRGTLDVPAVITSHGGDVACTNARLSNARLRQRYVQAVEAADALIAISRDTYDGLARLCPQMHKVIHIPNGVHLKTLDAPAPRPAELTADIRSGEYVLFLGRLKRRKGVDILLDALALLPRDDNVKLVVGGDGKERPALEAQAKRLGLTRDVRFVGTTQGMMKTYLLQNARCTVVPSRMWESFGLVVLESYAAGTPVISARLPGLGELILPGRTGTVVSPESPMELARALAHAFANGSEYARMGMEARAVAQHYSWSAVAREHLALYQELCTTHGQPSIRTWRLRIATPGGRLGVPNAAAYREPLAS